MAKPSERQALRQALDDLAATPSPPPQRSDAALAEYCRQQITHRRVSLGLLGLGLATAVVVLTIRWMGRKVSPTGLRRPRR
jgi:hypothetical protein